MSIRIFAEPNDVDLVITSIDDVPESALEELSNGKGED